MTEGTRFLATFDDASVNMEDGTLTYRIKIPYNQTPYLVAFLNLGDQTAIRLFRQVEDESEEVDLGPAVFYDFKLVAKRGYTLNVKSTVFDTLAFDRLKECVGKNVFLRVIQLSQADQATVRRKNFDRARKDLVNIGI